jgi:hypothetical protein
VDKTVVFSFVNLSLLLFTIFTIILGVSANAKAFQTLLSIFVNDEIDVKTIKIDKDNDIEINKDDIYMLKVS